MPIVERTRKGKKEYGVKVDGDIVGWYSSRAAARKQLTAISMSKARAAGHRMPPRPNSRRK